MQAKIKLLKNGLLCATLHCANKCRKKGYSMSLENFRHEGVYSGNPRTAVSCLEKRKAIATLIKMNILIPFRDHEGVERCNINPLITYKNVSVGGGLFIKIDWEEKPCQQ